VEAIQKNHQNHRKMALTKIAKQQTHRRQSLQLRVQARTKVKHSKVLSTSSYFSTLDSVFISKIIDEMEFIAIEEHNYDVCRQGDVADIFYIIITGICQVSIDGNAVALLGELDIFGESALFTEANGLSKRRATVFTVDQSVQLLALSQMKFNNLLASGALNEECVNKLRQVAEQRKQANEKTAIQHRNERRKKSVSVESIQLSLGKTIKHATQFRNIVGKLLRKEHGDGGGVHVDGDTALQKQQFQVMVEKIMLKVQKLKIEPETMDQVWLSACGSGGKQSDSLPCGMLERWMGLY